MRDSRLAAARGFTLIETVVALSLLGVALLLTMALLVEEPRVERRLDAHGEAVRVLEEQLEAIRAGAAGPASGMPVGIDPARLEAERDMQLWAEWGGTSPGGLSRLVLRVRYRVGEVFYDRTLETLVWTPPS